MVDSVYRNAFKEVYIILNNTDENLVSKIPQKFIKFIKENMNENYHTDIKNNIDIDKQPLLKETEAILSLIYRSYWATNEEKIELSKKDKNEFTNKPKKENIEDIFKNNENLKNITIDNNLMVLKKENFVKRLIKKIKNILIK